MSANTSMPLWASSALRRATISGTPCALGSVTRSGSARLMVRSFFSGSDCPLRGRGPTPPPAEEVDVRAHFAERVARRVDAIDPRDGVENDLPPLRLRVVHAGGQGDRAEGNFLATLRPGNAGVGHVVVVAG